MSGRFAVSGLLPARGGRDADAGPGETGPEQPAPNPTAAASTYTRMVLLARASRSPLLIWIVFAAVHIAVFVGTLPFTFRGTAGGDVSVYQGWMHHAIFTGDWPVFDHDWVYPAGALVPMLIPAVLGFGLYQVVWLVLMAVVNGVALWLLLDKSKRRHDLTAPWFWVATIAILAPVALMRLEGLVGPAVVVALLVVTARPRVAGFLLAAATWIKVWPAAVVLAMVIASSKRWIALVTGILTSAVVVGVVLAAGGARYLTSFVGEQGSRGLQIEAPFAAPWLWMTVAGVPGAHIYHDHKLVTEEVTGPGDSWLISNGTLIMVVVMVALLVLLALATRRLSAFAKPLGRELDLVLLGALGLAAAFIVFNKVGSPQYVLWLTPIVAVGLMTKRSEWRFPGAVLIIVCVLTTLVYPVLYDDLLAGGVGTALLLTVRNLLLIVIFVWATYRLARAAFVPVTLPLSTRPFGSEVRTRSY
ncbi:MULTISPECIES: glycosyltransferase family 87 protein [unclassified Frondihabitans]|uniref:glycosyltransferase family 87 protein n=1 Tax=unclassified Frondihabitans TaxID=2626248 RepID=UPI000F4D8D84|nr:MULTISPECIES: glycosyltransferase family 87 protein [unclassified Frondihabitans]